MNDFKDKLSGEFTMLNITVSNTIVTMAPRIVGIDFEDPTTNIPDLVRTLGRSLRQYLLSRLNEFYYYINDSILFMDNIVHDETVVCLRDYFGLAPNDPLCFTANVVYDGNGAELNFLFRKNRLEVQVVIDDKIRSFCYRNLGFEACGEPGLSTALWNLVPHEKDIVRETYTGIEKLPSLFLKNDVPEETASDDEVVATYTDADMDQAFARGVYYSISGNGWNREYMHKFILDALMNNSTADADTLSDMIDDLLTESDDE